MPIQLRHLQYVIAAAEHGSFRRAAAAFGIQESAISRRIRDFEDRLGEALFIRSPSGVKLTHAGILEVKASATVKAGDFGGLRALADACGDRFAFGVVLYDSTDVVPFDDRLAAAPLSSLWDGKAPTNKTGKGVSHGAV